MNFKGVIFDLDGTLVNSLEDIADSMNKVLERLGYPQHNLQSYKYFVGNGLRNLVRRALPEGSDEGFISSCFALMMEEYRKNCINKTRPYAGIVELLDELSFRQIKLAIFSNKVHELTQIVVETLLPKWDFEVVLGASPEVPRKPNPMGVLLISKKMGIDSERFIYLGDTNVDMETANRAGMYAVGALWGFRTKEELISNGAKYLLNHPLDLLNILN
jgi:phosphoglycolate phosphatase